MLDPLTLVGLGFTATTVGSLIALHLRKVIVPKRGEWTLGPPPVAYHPGIGKELKIDLIAAVQFWEGLGYPCESVYASTEAPSYGIYVDLMLAGEPLEEGQGGIASATFAHGVHAEPRPLKFCRIVIDPGLDGAERLKCIRHELGHAHGFDHAYAGLDKKGRVRAHPSGHVMHPKLEKCGKGTRGIRA